jgi:multicomponent Na+:H+ antiporter subunit E
VRLGARIVVLVALWLLAWGGPSVANFVSGLLVACLLLVAFPPARHSGPRLRIRPLGVARLLLHILRQLVTSNFLVAREIISRRSSVRTGVLAYHVQHPSDEVVTLVANVLALTPGTMTVEATRDPAVIYVHVLLLEGLDKARQSIARLEELVVDAVGFQHPHARATVSPKEP